MKEATHGDTPFPLKKYYLLYGGMGSVLFYVLLFVLFIHAERQALYGEYIHSVSEKARNLYLDIDRDFLKPQGISVEGIASADREVKEHFRREVEEIVAMDFSLTKLKLFRVDAVTLYDSSDSRNEGALYDSRDDTGFRSALQGLISTEIEVEDDGRRLMEAYFPIKRESSGEVVAVLEIYEDVSRFEGKVRQAMKNALVLPTAVFVVFNLVLFLIVAKADGIIADKTNLLVTIRRNMEKYISQSAVSAIYKAVSQSTELFHGERQSIIVWFSDIRSFTSYSETTEPEDVVHTLNRLFEIQAGIIHRHGGVIDKFVGDEIMVTFSAGCESAAVLAAMEILAAVDSDSGVAMKVGIGIHSGEAVVGSIGTADRRDYTAIGDTVNIGARICAACPQDSVYVSSSIFDALPDEMKARFSSREALALKGKAEKIEVHLFSPAGTAGTVASS